MTRDDAKLIRDTVFGPCTPMYECMDLSDIIEEAGDKSAKEYALQALADMKIRDGYGMDIQMESGEDMSGLAAEQRDMYAAIARRIEERL